ncbi:MAG: heme o synthase [Flavobacteriales bacterium]|nr:heme o synthase [Flavobacteriales bacterium]
MLAEDTIIEKVGFATKLKDYALLTKLRLAFLVVISAVATFIFAGGAFSWDMLLLISGGFLITGSSNAFNQYIEREIDALMDRTKNRPLPAGRMKPTEAIVVAILTGVLGATLLFSINFLSGVLGVLALALYVLIYTPLKRITPWAVFAGAFPGAIPPMLGVVAVTGTLSGEAGLLAGIMFLVQFVWQFPHFWAIAWVKDDDYAKGGFSLLPSKLRKSKNSAFQIVLYSLFLILVTVLPWVFDYCGKTTLIIGAMAGIWFFMLSYRLYLTLEDKSARSLMFASFIYLPIVQFLYVFDKI